MALLSVVNDGDNKDSGKKAFFFTDLGLEQDAKFVKEWVAEISNSDEVSAAKENLKPLI